MTVYRTEIASSKLSSDNPIHQRLLFAYETTKQFVSGDLLEIGCGEGRGVALLTPFCESYTAIDKNKDVMIELSEQYSSHTFISANIPPLSMLDDNSFDTVITFQVIEHIKNDQLFLEEIFRVLKPGGKMIITTPNIEMTLTRNPWHIREYTGGQLKKKVKKNFDKVSMKGVFGNDTIMSYYQKNKDAVNKILRYDILNLQYWLPRFLIKIPYEMLNKRNRNALLSGSDDLVKNITVNDYYLNEYDDSCLDLYCVAEK